MTMTARRLATSQVAASIASVYTAPTGTKAVIKSAVFTNTSGGAVTLLAHLVPPTGSVADGNMAINNVSIGAGESYVSPELAGQVIEATGSLDCEASTSGSLTAIISGVEIT